MRELRVAIVGVGELAGQTWAVIAEHATAWLLVTTDTSADDVPVIDGALGRLGLPGLAAGCATFLDLRSTAMAS